MSAQTQPLSKPTSSRRKATSPPTEDVRSSKRIRSAQNGKKVSDKAARGGNRYHIRRKCVPNDANGLVIALQTHIRLLLGCYGDTSVPDLPDTDTILRFESRFANNQVIRKRLNVFGGNSAIAADQAAFKELQDIRRDVALDRGSVVAQRIAAIPDHSIRLIYSSVHDFDLPVWRPDFLGSPTSHYNTALQTIALHSFEQAVLTSAYDHLQVNLAFLRDTRAIKACYDSFVWSYLHGLVVKELRSAGSVKQTKNDNRAYKRRARLTKTRRAYLHTEGFPKRVLTLLANPECTSDDERGPTRNSGFLVFSKRARNPHVTDFFRTFDTKRLAGQPLTRGQPQRSPEARNPHVEDKESTISCRVPVNCALDWFDPKVFNGYDINFRARFTKAKIALPCAEDILNDPSYSWMKLSDEEFMAAHGNKVKAMYNLPTADDLARLKAAKEAEHLWAAGVDDDDDEDDDDDYEDGTDADDEDDMDEDSNAASGSEDDASE